MSPDAVDVPDQRHRLHADQHHRTMDTDNKIDRLKLFSYDKPNQTASIKTIKYYDTLTEHMSICTSHNDTHFTIHKQVALDTQRGGGSNPPLNLQKSFELCTLI